jgi:tellurium resistance protein TerD
MTISLVKGGNISLSKQAPGLTAVRVGLGWDTRATDGDDFDLDASVFVLNAAGRVRSDADFVFFNNKVAADGAVEHQGDNQTGDGDGDDEVVAVKIERLPADVQKLSFGVSIYDSDARRQNFGMVSNAYIRIVDAAGGAEIARYDLSEDASTETAMIFGELYRHGGEWKFKAIGQGFAGGLEPLARSFGVGI